MSPHAKFTSAYVRRFHASAPPGPRSLVPAVRVLSPGIRGYRLPPCRRRRHYRMDVPGRTVLSSRRLFNASRSSSESRSVCWQRRDYGSSCSAGCRAAHRSRGRIRAWTPAPPLSGSKPRLMPLVSSCEVNREPTSPATPVNNRSAAYGLHNRPCPCAQDVRAHFFQLLRETNVIVQWSIFPPRVQQVARVADRASHTLFVFLDEFMEPSYSASSSVNRRRGRCRCPAPPPPE